MKIKGRPVWTLWKLVYVQRAMNFELAPSVPGLSILSPTSVLCLHKPLGGSTDGVWGSSSGPHNVEKLTLLKAVQLSINTLKAASVPRHPGSPQRL